MSTWIGSSSFKWFIQQNDARVPIPSHGLAAWLSSPTGIIRSGYEGMISALLIEAPLRLGEFSPKLYLVAKMKQDLHHHLEVGLEAAVAGSIVLLNHLSEHNESLVIRAKRDGSLVSAVDIESHRAISAILVQISDTECANRSEKTIPAILKDAIHFGNTAVVVTYLHLHWENACA